MSFASPWWLVLMLIWPVIPLFDRVAHPSPQASLPLPHLAERGLKRLPYSLPWLSIHGLAFLLLVLALAGPRLSTRAGWQQSPPLFVVAVAEPGQAKTVQARFDELLAANPDRPIGVMVVRPEGPQLLSPLTGSPALLRGLQLPATSQPLATSSVTHSLLAASVKAPAGAWLVVVGGRAHVAWQPVLNAATKQRQMVCHLHSDPGAELPFAYTAALTDADAVAGLRFQLEQASIDQPLPGPPHELDRYCLLAALLTLVLGWYWRQNRWQVVGP